MSSRIENLPDLGPNYHVESVLLSRGELVYYSVWDRINTRRMSVRALVADIAESEADLDLFAAEAQAAADLCHPSLPTSYGVHRLGNSVYSFSEWLEGEQLSDWMRKREHVDLCDALRVAIQLVRVVAYLHERGFVHLALSGDAVVLRADRSVKLADLGRTCFTHESRERDPATTELRAVSLDEPLPSALTDVFHLGRVIFELCAGQDPELLQHRDGSYPSLAAHNPQAPSMLVAIVDRCLQPVAAHRPDSLGHVLKALQEVFLQLRATGERVSGSFAAARPLAPRRPSGPRFGKPF